MEMSGVMKDIVAVLSALIGLAMLAVLLQSQNTSSIISAGSSGFTDMLKAAMGNTGGD